VLIGEGTRRWHDLGFDDAARWRAPASRRSLESKEGWRSSTQASTAVAALAWSAGGWPARPISARRCDRRAARLVSSVQARLHDVRPHRAARAADLLRCFEARASSAHENCGRVQDAYAMLRTQVPARLATPSRRGPAGSSQRRDRQPDGLRRQTTAAEGAGDVSGGNFHGAPVASPPISS
jgi:histidine ammonia-lyase